MPVVGEGEFYVKSGALVKPFGVIVQFCYLLGVQPQKSQQRELLRLFLGC